MVKVSKDGVQYFGGRFTELKEAVDVANNLRQELFGIFATYETYKENT